MNISHRQNSGLANQPFGRVWEYFLLSVAAFLVTLTAQVVVANETSADDYLDYGEVLDGLVQSSAMGIFTRGLFDFEPGTRPSITFQDLPMKGGAWIPLLKRRWELDDSLVNSQAASKLQPWLDGHDLKQRVGDLVDVHNEKFAQLEEDSQLRAKYCGDNEDNIPKDADGDPLVSCLAFSIAGDAEILAHDRSEIDFLIGIQKTSAATVKECMTPSQNPVCQNIYRTFWAWQYVFDDPYDRLVAAEEACEDEGIHDDDTMESACLVYVLANDYANDLIYDERVDIAVQHDYLTRKALSDDQKALVETKLTEILESIRTVLQARVADGDGDARTLAPARVRIVAPDFLIKANRREGVIDISQSVLRNILLRAFHRASAFYALEFGQPLGLYEEASDALDGLVEIIAEAKPGELTPSQQRTIAPYQGDDFDDARDAIDVIASSFPCCTVYSRSLPHYLELVHTLPGLRQPFLSASWLRSEMSTLEDDDLGYRWQQYIAILDEVGDGDAVSGLTRTNIASVAATLQERQPEMRRDTRIHAYLQAMQAVDQAMDQAESQLEMEAMLYMALYSEAVVLQQQVSTEILKSVLFILAHESWHLWFGGKDRTPTGLELEEFEADAHGMRTYLETYPEIDLQSWLGGETPELASTGRDTFLEAFTGRRPDVILEETYRGTKYYDGYFYHPPISARLEKLRAQIDAGRKVFSAKLNAQLACLSNFVASGEDAAKLAAACTVE